MTGAAQGTPFTSMARKVVSVANSDSCTNPAAGTKLVCLVLGSAATAACHPLLLLPAAVAMIATLAKLDEKPGDIARDARFLIPLAVLVLALRLFFPADGRVFAPEEVLPGIAYIARLLIVFLIAQVFFRTTSVNDLGATITRATRFVYYQAARFTSLTRKVRKNPKIRCRVADPGLYIGLAAGFLPRSFECYDKVSEAAAARGFGATRPKVGSILVLMETVLFASVKSAVGTASALEARCYTPERTLQAVRAGRSDRLLFAATLVYFVLSLIH